MRLLDARALIYENVAELVDFPDESSAPEFAILSHTWEEEEVLFQDIALGPQHEIRPSIASIRALRRQSDMTHHSSSHFHLSSSDDTAMEMSDEDSMNVSMSPSASGDPMSVSSLSSDNDASTPLGRSSSNLSNCAASLQHAPHVKAGWNKVLNTCLQTVRDELMYVWIDTCCIDKSSSAELSEAINSMYRWYEAAAICYAYLSDCDLTSGRTDSVNVTSPYLTKVKSRVLGLGPFPDIQFHLKHSRWFTRGWTLQELISPVRLHFFDRDWRFIANRKRIVPALESITGIHGEVLSRPRQRRVFSSVNGFWLSRYSVAQRMHWASQRRTTRKEDEAYSLLGIFGINMPLLYGEGSRAFQRLQEEIIRTSTDQTIFAWELLPGSHDGEDFSRRILAQSPANFWWHAHDITTTLNDTQEIRLTSEGIEIDLCLEKFRSKYGYEQIIGQLNCAFKDIQREWSIGIRLQVLPQSSRPGCRFVTDVNPEHASSIEESVSTARRLILLPIPENDDEHSTDKILISHSGSFSYSPEPPSLDVSLVFLQEHSESENGGWVLMDVYPRSQWHAAMAKMTLPQRSTAYGAIAMTRRYMYQEVVIVFGGVTPTPNDPYHEESLCKYWILKGPRRWNFDWASHVVEHYLKRLCDRAGQLSSMDYFERSTSRQDCHKWIRLEDSEIVCPSVTRGLRLQQYIHIECNKVQVQDFGGDKDSGPLADRDYFRLENYGYSFTERKKMIRSLARQRRQLHAFGDLPF